MAQVLSFIALFLVIVAFHHCHGQQFQFSRLWHPGKRSTGLSFSTTLLDPRHKENGELRSARTEQMANLMRSLLAVPGQDEPEDSDDTELPPGFAEDPNAQSWFRCFAAGGPSPQREQQESQTGTEAAAATAPVHKV